ncbi:MAG: DUF1818 family protein [Cyanobium sp.]
MQVREGEGWRLEHDPARHPFVVLLGGGPEQGGWAAELTAAEATALRGAVLRLQAEHAALVPLLLEEEAIDLELEVACAAGALWLGLGGRRSHWCLRFVLSPGPGQRAVEGSWNAAASAAVAAALAALPLGEGAGSGPDSS